MKHLWLNKNNNENIIVFFNGWGMDENIVSHLDCENYDVVMFYDYRDFNIEKIDFSKYKNKYLIAWSMGVKVSGLFYELVKDFDKKIAINGTNAPVDDNYGIPVFAYDLMINNFNELTQEKFFKKISKEDDKYCTRNIDELKEELIMLKDFEPKQYIKFDKAIVSLKDRIIPSKNQINFWDKEGVQVMELEAMHSIFNLYSKWGELL